MVVDLECRPAASASEWTSISISMLQHQHQHGSASASIWRSLGGRFWMTGRASEMALAMSAAKGVIGAAPRGPRTWQPTLTLLDNIIFFIRGGSLREGSRRNIPRYSPRADFRIDAFPMVFDLKRLFFIFFLSFFQITQITLQISLEIAKNSKK